MDLPFKKRISIILCESQWTNQFESIKTEDIQANGGAMSFQKLIQKENSVLVLIDMQEKLLPSIFESEKVLNYSTRMIKVAQTLNIPILITEQIKLGPTHPELLKLLTEPQVMTKSSFSCARDPQFMKALKQQNPQNVILIGIETHVCVLQTALQLVGNYNVHLVKEAVSSRTEENKKIALQRMKAAGIVMTSFEMLTFELLQKAGTDEFKSILPLVK